MEQVKIAALENLAEALETVIGQTAESGEHLATYTVKLRDVLEATMILGGQLEESGDVE